MNRILLIFVLSIMGCAMSNDQYRKDVEHRYAKINFQAAISQSGAETIFQKYVIDNGWPWVMSGGNTKPIDKGDYWAIQYMTCMGTVDENADWMIIDKVTGKIEKRAVAQDK